MVLRLAQKIGNWSLLQLVLLQSTPIVDGRPAGGSVVVANV